MHALNLNVSIVNILDHSKVRCAIILDAAVLSYEISTQVVNVRLCIVNKVLNVHHM